MWPKGSLKTPEWVFNSSIMINFTNQQIDIYILLLTPSSICILTTLADSTLVSIMAPNKLINYFLLGWNCVRIYWCFSREEWCITCHKLPCEHSHGVSGFAQEHSQSCAHFCTNGKGKNRTYCYRDISLRSSMWMNSGQIKPNGLSVFLLCTLPNITHVTHLSSTSTMVLITEAFTLFLQKNWKRKRQWINSFIISQYGGKLIELMHCWQNKLIVNAQIPEGMCVEVKAIIVTVFIWI